jgi:hypothetical protein
MICFGGSDPRSLSNDTLCFGVSALSGEPSPEVVARGYVPLAAMWELILCTVFRGDSKSAIVNDGKDAVASRLRWYPRE